ncbi:MAG: hypothetical protein GKR96_02400 [Gammaproteobacteria bacterium]|nr:hypothetical protein [Gammaproteobacteria bacterium]
MNELELDQEAIIDLQMRLMDQEQSIEVLSQQLLHQSGLIETLSKSIKVLETKLSQLNDTGSDVAVTGEVEGHEHRPPHY